MTNREKLANGIFEVDEKPRVLAALDAPIPEWDDMEEDNFFLEKDMSRLDRMDKSQRARAWRRKVRNINQKRHQRGYRGTNTL